MNPEAENCINLKKLAELIGDDDEFIREILTDFYRELNFLTNRIEDRIENNIDGKEIKLDVHTLKGLCGNVCALELYEILMSVDKALKNDNYDEAARNLCVFMNAKKVTQKFLQKYLNVEE